MAGDSSTMENGFSKAALAPFKKAFYFTFALILIFMGRAIADSIAYANDKITPEYALNILTQDIETSKELPDFLSQSSEERALEWSDTIYDWYWVKTGFDSALFKNVNKDKVSADEALARGLRAKLTYWEVVISGTRDLAVRASNLVSFIPLYILFVVVAVVDGLSSRHIRKTNAARESATIYHRAKYLDTSFLTLFLATYLWNPFTPYSTQVISIGLLASAALIRLQVTYYKKYV